jgi:dephospho-CoA kinase
MDKTILAVVGLPGSGKSETTNYIIEKTGWPKVYFGQITFDELARRGLPVSEVNERAVREELRKEHGMGAYAILNIPKIKEILKNSDGVVLESFYSWEEYIETRKEFGDRFRVLALWASPETRTRRMQARPDRPLKPEELESRDFSQIENLHQAGPIARSDFLVINEGDFGELHRNLDGVLKNIIRS